MWSTPCLIFHNRDIVCGIVTVGARRAQELAKKEQEEADEAERVKQKALWLFYSHTNSFMAPLPVSSTRYQLI